MASGVPTELEPPRPVTPVTLEFPLDATPIDAAVTVHVKLVVAKDGTVAKVELVTGAQPALDRAVIAAVRALQFTPARYRGQAVSVAIDFRHTFLPPPPPPASAPDGGPPLVSVLRGRLVEKGTRVPVTTATLAVEVGTRRYSVEVDRKGRFRLPLPAGRARVSVHGTGYRPFLQYEDLQPAQEVAVAYYVERERYDPYEILVFGETKRQELSRITLRGPEIRQVPGTFGDPFRVVQTLPGVASIVSLLPFPVVRGASPGSTGFLVDGTRVPLLYHLLAGPSVIHPEFIDEVQFYPGGAPVPYGGYTAGIVDGRTRRARLDETLYDADMNLLQTGVLVRRPVPALGATVTAAGRIGYPGVIISLATDEASLAYWDYQLRLDGGQPRNGWTLFAFGAEDEVKGVDPAADPALTPPPLITVLKLGFHRLDLRGHGTSGRFDGVARLVAGLDETRTGTAGGLRTWVVEPDLRGRWRRDEELEVLAGLDGSFHKTGDLAATATTSGPQAPSAFVAFTEDLTKQWQGGAWLEALWRPTPRWLVRPGVRADGRYDGTTAKFGFDPRAMLRYRLGTFDALDLAGTGTDSADSRADRAVWLKGGAGVYHQPPRFFLPLPGLDVMPLRFGLLQAIQTSLGVEIPLGGGTQLNVESFYNDMDPIVFDLQTNAQSVTQLAPQRLPGELPQEVTATKSAADRALDRLLAPQLGRAYGIEVLVRRQSRHGLYGWLAYTLSRSERLKDGAWVPYDYDRSHLVNLVAGLPLPRNWDVGARLQWQSGKPATTTHGYNTARIDSYLRIDVRIDKRAVWNKWLFDFYVDVTNIAVFPEEVSPGNILRYVLPTVGVRGRL